MKKTMKDATIRIRNMNFASGQIGFAVDFEGYNEGSGHPCYNKEEVEECLKRLLQEHSIFYKIKVIDERIKENLTQWF